MTKIHKFVPRSSASANRARRNIIRELSSGEFDQILFAARKVGTLEWVFVTDADIAEWFYGCELLKAEAQAELLVQHLNRIEEENGA